MEDDSTAAPKGSDTDLQRYALSGKVMCFSVIALLAILFLIICFHLYGRFRSLRGAAAQAQPRKSCRRRRHHPSLLKSVTTFNYSSGAHPQGLECAVCLSEFQEAETGRVLPDCGHCFHIECIDTWFRSHSNCPLCRAPVNPPRKPDSGEFVVQIGEYCAGDAVGSDPDSVECRRKSLELVAELPRPVL